jgi:hypothetical protein
MKLHVITSLVCLSIMLSGCQLTRVEGNVGGTDVKVSSDTNKSSEGKFCPPGQAKKGRC